MSRNGNGQYNLPTGNPVVGGTTITSSWANTTLTDIATALTNSIAADGQTPVTGNINMGNNKIIDLAPGTTGTDAINYAQFSTPTFPGDVTVEGDLYVIGQGNFDTNLVIPVGTTAQRPTTPTDGMIRFNTTSEQYEGNFSQPGQSIASITYGGSTATLTTNSPHGLTTGDYVTISGATPAVYNGSYNVTVLNALQFTYVMVSTPISNASPVGSYVAHQWNQLGGGATGAGGDQVFVENSEIVTVSYTIPTGKNASSVGPITVNPYVTVGVPSGSRWVIL